MEVLIGLIVLVVAFFVIGAIVEVFSFLGFVLKTYWPFLVGGTLGLLLIVGGRYNFGVAMIILGVVSGAFWLAYMDSREPQSSDPMSGKRAHYDSSGRIVGYSDKD